MLVVMPRDDARAGVARRVLDERREWCQYSLSGKVTIAPSSDPYRSHRLGSSGVSVRKKVAKKRGVAVAASRIVARTSSGGMWSKERVDPADVRGRRRRGHPPCE
jgi:hypothetical protein